MPPRQQSKDRVETRVYQYGLIPKGQFPEAAIEELWRGNQLWNRLVELNNQFLEKMEALRRHNHAPYDAVYQRLESLNREIDAAYDAMRQIRMEEGTKDKTESPRLNAAHQTINALAAKRKGLYAEIKAMRKETDKSIGDALGALRGEHRDEKKQARSVKNNGLFSPTAVDIYDYFETALARVIENPGSRLRFHRFDGTGFFSFWLKRKGAKATGVSFKEMFVDDGSDKRLQFLRLDDSRKKPRIHIRATLAGGGKKADKVIHEFDVVYHRPIPEDGLIKNGQITRRRTGDKFSYFLNLTVQTPINPEPIYNGEGVIGIDLNWNDNNGKIFVGAVASTDASFTYNPVCVPEALLKAMEYESALKSDLDSSAIDLGKALPRILKQRPLDEGHKKYRLWRLAAQPKPNTTLACETAYKLARWCLWDGETLPDEARNLIHNWWKQWGRKYREHHNLRQKTLAHRKHIYRNEALKLVSLGKPIAMEALQLNKMAETKNVSTKLGAKARSQRFKASPSEFADAIRNAAKRDGVLVIKVNPKNTSKTCSVCGEPNDIGKKRAWDCAKCGTHHDRDTNAAINIARRGREKLQKGEK